MNHNQQDQEQSQEDSRMEEERQESLSWLINTFRIPLHPLIYDQLKQVDSPFLMAFTRLNIRGL